MRAAVMGMRHGHISEFVRAVEENEAVSLVGIAEDEPTVRARIESEHSVPVYADFEELLDKEQPQVVGVARTNATKFLALTACLERGINVIADKPLLTEMGQLEQVRAANVLGKARLGMMLSQRFSAPHRALKAQVEAGDFGEIVHMYGFGPHKLRPHTRNPWELDAAQNGGVLVDLGVHYFDSLRWFSGQEPVRVAAAQGNTRFPELPQLYDHAHALMEFDGGMKGLVVADWLTPDAAPYHGDYRLYVTGTRGTAEIATAGTLEPSGPNKQGGVRVVLNDKEPFDLDVPPLQHTPTSDFLEALVNDREPYGSAEEVLRTMEVTLHAKAAAESGDWVSIPAK
ncbi:MAG: Gfo/Idh/MocA family oxidoreductase [Chloroflexi bacterium]|nr:Gfo/Idh/MocA family oxidoreductase [Chloroflexota bacterium]